MKNKNDKNIKSEGNLKDLALNYIRKLILEENKLHKGEWINEHDISRALNISRSPVREALNELKEKGLVSYVKYKGWFVAEIDKNEFREIMELRTLLQFNLLKYVINNGGPKTYEIETLKTLNTEMKNIIKNKKSEGSSNYDFWKKEMEFHNYICELAKDKYKMTQKINRDLSYQIFSSLQEFLNEGSQLKKSVECHDDIIDAIINKDLEKLEKVMYKKANKLRHF